MSKPVIVVVLLLAAGASAALVFFAMSALSTEEEAPPTVASEPQVSAPAEPEVTDAELLLRTDITDANLFVDAFDRGPIEAESRRTLPLGPHRVEARRGATVIAALTVELGANGAEVVLHADGTTTQTEGPQREVRVAARTTVRANTGTAAEPEPSEAPAAELPPPSVEVAAATREPEPEPAREAPAGVEPAPTAPIVVAPRVATANIEVVDQSAATNVMPAPAAPAPTAPAPTTVAAPVVRPQGPPGPPPNEGQMRAALQSVLPAVRTCAGDFHGELEVTASFMPDGSVRARIGRLPTREARYCVQARIQETVRLRAFEGRAASFRHTYRL
ncbi:MAG: hypothetical protein H6723_05325 [Sandaracinus sp.]|nr:hypothetical protein [Sandaracinus sp.]